MNRAVRVSGAHRVGVYRQLRHGGGSASADDETTVGKWRSQFVERRLEGLYDEPRVGAPRTISDEQVEAINVKTLETSPPGETHWSTRSMAKAAGVSHTMVGRIWRTVLNDFVLLAVNQPTSDATRRCSGTTRRAESTAGRCFSTLGPQRFCMRSHRVVGVLVVAVTLLRIAAERADLQGASVYPLKLSPDGTYVTDRAGQPFFMNGDTAWSLIAQLSRVDADRYLSDRAATGFNTILVNLLEHRFANHAPSNRAGEPPFARPGDFTAPNPAYFANADWMIARAGERGILVLLDALYLGYDCGNEGWCAEVKASSPAALRMFGRYLGTRYRNVPNIVWVIGGDTDPVANGVGPHLRALVAGIRAADTTHLFTAHNGPEQSAMDVWAGESWLGLNNVYTYKNTWTKSLAERARQGAKPLFLMESAYENEHASTPLSLRRQAYGAVLSGATAGHLFGNCPIWHFNALTGAKFCTAGNWQDQLGSPGSATLALVGPILTSRRFHLLDPDHNHAVVTSGFESGADYASAARARDGSSILVYLPTPRTIRVDLSKLSGPLARGWWVNPGTALSTAAGEFPTSVARDFTPPDTNDWLLVLDDASLDLPAPGKRRP